MSDYVARNKRIKIHLFPFLARGVRLLPENLCTLSYLLLLGLTYGTKRPDYV